MGRDALVEAAQALIRSRTERRTASRAGRGGFQSAAADDANGHENNVFVEHADGTVARYTHLQQGSVAVATGVAVVAGQRLGLSGSSGNTGGQPHLHLETFRGRNYAKSNSLPVNFRNAEGALDARGGLAAGTLYAAGPY